MKARTDALPVALQTVAQVPAILPQSMSKYKIIPERTMDEEEEGGFYVGLDDLRIIYHALKQYKPPKDEAYMHEILCETFEEALWSEVHADDEAEPDADSLNDL